MLVVLKYAGYGTIYVLNKTFTQQNMCFLIYKYRCEFIYLEKIWKDT